MPTRGTVAVAAAVLCAASLLACGESEPPAGAPAAPESGALTDCEQLSAPATDRRRAATAGHGRPPYGFNDHAGLVGAIPISEDVELQERAGSSLWRVAVDWRHVEPEPGEISLETHDAIYCEALAHRIRPILHITGAPDWAADAGECPVTVCIDPPRDSALDDLRDFAELIARRYPQAAAIEAWNEPNLATFWTEPDPGRYVDVLAAIHAGVKAVEPSMPILGGSLSNTRRTDATRYDFARFLKGMYAAGAARYMDAIAFHPYPIAPLGSPEERFMRSMTELRRRIRAAGDEGRSIWVTEVGLPIGADVSPGEQARTLRRIYERLASDEDVEAVIFHTLLEGEEEAGSGSGFGWLVPRSNGEVAPRPVLSQFTRGW